MSRIEGDGDNINSTPPHLGEERINELMEIARSSERYGDIVGHLLKGVEIPVTLANKRSTHKTIRTPHCTFITSARTPEERNAFVRKLNTRYGL